MHRSTRRPHLINIQINEVGTVKGNTNLGFSMISKYGLLITNKRGLGSATRKSPNMHIAATALKELCVDQADRVYSFRRDYTSICPNGK